MDTAHTRTNTRTTTICLPSAVHNRRGGRGTPAACTGRQPKYGPDAVIVPMRQRGGGSTTFASDLFPVIGSGRVPQAPYSAILCHRAPQGGSQRTDVSHTCAASPVTLPSALFASMSHLQEAENPGNTMLQQRTPQPGAHIPAPALENMRPPWTPALPSLHTHVYGLLCPRASQSVHASTNTPGQQQRPKAHANAMPTLPKPLTLPPSALTIHPSHTACPQAMETQDPPPFAYGRPTARNVGRRRDGSGSPPVWTEARKGNTRSGASKARAERF